MSQRSKPGGRGPVQISLRSLFLLTLIVAAYLAGYRTASIRQAQAEQARQDQASSAAEAQQQAAAEHLWNLLDAENALIDAERELARRYREQAERLQQPAGQRLLDSQKQRFLDGFDILPP